MDENYNRNSENNETRNVNFNADGNITVVEKAKDNKAGKLPFIIIACVLALAIITGCVIYFAKPGGNDKENNVGNIVGEDPDHDHYNDSDLMDYIYESMSEEMTDENGSVISREEYVSKLQQQVQEATTTLSEDVGVTSPHVIETEPAGENNGENEGNGNQDNNNDNNKEQREAAEKQIAAFFNRSCYFQGALYGGNSGDSISVALDGDNFEAFSNLDGTEISILKLSGKTYLKRPATKQYIEFTDSLMNMMGISSDDFSFEFGSASYDDIKSKLASVYDITVDGEKGICHEYKTESRTFRFYSVGGQLKQLDTCDENGAIVSQLAISYFSEAIPADRLTLKGYTESTLGAIFADLMVE